VAFLSILHEAFLSILHDIISIVWYMYVYVRKMAMFIITLYVRNVELNSITVWKN